MRRKPVALAAVLAAVILLAAVVGVMYERINTQYPNPMVLTAQPGESLSYESTAISVQGHKILEQEEIRALFPDSELAASSRETRLVQVEVSLQSNKEAKLPLYLFALQNGLSSTQPSRELMFDLYGSSQMQLAAGEEKSILLYFPFVRSAYLETDWNRFSSLPFQMELVDTYPRRYCFPLTL